MIIHEEVGDILQCTAQSLVVPVNTVGVMGKGLALAFANTYPTLLPAYKKACLGSVFKREGLFVHRLESEDRNIVCLPTKRHWRNPSKLEWIEEAMESLANGIGRYHITSLAIPALGCGEGRLGWDEVYPVIQRYMNAVEIPVMVFLPFRK